MSRFFGKGVVSTVTLWVVKSTASDVKYGAFGVGEPKLVTRPGVGADIIDVIDCATDGEKLSFRSEYARNQFMDGIQVDVNIFASAKWGDQYEPGAEYDLRDAIVSRLFALIPDETELGALRYSRTESVSDADPKMPKVGQFVVAELPERERDGN